MAPNVCSFFFLIIRLNFSDVDGERVVGYIENPTENSESYLYIIVVGANQGQVGSRNNQLKADSRSGACRSCTTNLIPPET